MLKPKAVPAAALALTLLAPAAQAQQVTLKVAHFLPPSSSAQINIIQPWCDKIARESGDKLKCQIYPSMQLGGTPAQLMDQVRDGVTDIVWTVPTYSAGRYSKSEVFELPFVITNAKAGSQALWTYTHKYAMDEFKGVKPIFMHVHDGAIVNTNKPVSKLEDMKGLKLRAPSRQNAKLANALGATPVQMPLPQVPEAISKGVVDGGFIPWEAFPAIRLHEVTKYHTEMPKGAAKLGNTIFMFGMNQAKYDSLPADLKKVIDANSGLEVSAMVGDKGFDALIPTFQKLAADRRNMISQISAEEYQRWVKAADAVDDEWIKDVTAKGADGKKLLQEARALVKQYEK